jgi:hypothetical protein
MIAHGVTVERMVELVRRGWRPQRKRVVAPGRPEVEIARVRIMEAGGRGARRGKVMTAKKRTYEPRIFEGRVMLPEEQEQIYIQALGGYRFHARADLGGMAGAGAQGGAEDATGVTPPIERRTEGRSGVAGRHHRPLPEAGDW